MNRKIFKFIWIIFIFTILIAIGFLFTSDIKNSLNINIKRENFDTVLHGKDICTLAIIENTIYAGGANGLFKIDIISLNTKKINNFRYVRAIISDGKKLWIGHDDGLSYIEDTTALLQTPVTYTKKDGLPDNRVNALTIDKDNNLWVGTWGGAVMFDGKNFTLYTTENGLINSMVNVILQDGIGGIWFGSYVAPRGGISIFYNNKWQYFTTDNALIHANINIIIETKDGAVIVGGGLYNKGGGRRFIYNGNKWTKSYTLTKSDGLAGEKIRSMFEDNMNRLWVGSEYDGLAILSYESASTSVNSDTNGSAIAHTSTYRSASIVKLDINSGLSNNEVKIVEEDKWGNMWIGTRGGLVRILKGGF